MKLNLNTTTPNATLIKLKERKNMQEENDSAMESFGCAIILLSLGAFIYIVAQAVKLFY